MKIRLLLSLTFVFTISLNAQENSDLNWYNLDYNNDNILGVSTEKTYNELIKGEKPKKTIIVAILDSGLDIYHEDLEGNIWVNEDEIPDNNIDDDNNNYVDDVYGWNFLGNSDGELLIYDNFEQVRAVREFIEEINEDPDLLDNKSLLKENEKYLNYVEDNIKLAKENYTYVTEIIEAERIAKEILSEKITELSLENIENFPATNDEEIWAKESLLKLNNMGISTEELKPFLKNFTTDIDKHYNIKYNARELIIKDNINSITDTDYGNNKVWAIEPVHGTGVGSLIAANRNNDIGINGIANAVKLMPLRVVPDGDEYDKDVALAIRYAVDNGANIINMSFGKDISPNKFFVDDAIKYAEEHNVLLVHASGNDANNIDKVESYPKDLCIDNHIVTTWVEVGANGKDLNTLNADFSNYGKKAVDVYAPGVSIYTCVPNDKYETMDGTSFACPVFSGVAALIWSYFPNLTAVQLKEILLNSAQDFSDIKTTVLKKRGKGKSIKFKKLSQTGGVVNAYNAFKLAKEY